MAEDRELQQQAKKNNMRNGRVNFTAGWLVTTLVVSRWSCCWMSPSRVRRSIDRRCARMLYVSSSGWCNAPNRNVESAKKNTTQHCWGLHSGACTVFYGKEIFKCHSINYLFAMLGVWSSALRSCAHLLACLNILFLRDVVSRLWSARRKYCQSAIRRLLSAAMHSSAAIMHSHRSFNGVIFDEIERKK